MQVTTVGLDLAKDVFHVHHDHVHGERVHHVDRRVPGDHEPRVCVDEGHNRGRVDLGQSEAQWRQQRDEKREANRVRGGSDQRGKAAAAGQGHARGSFGNGFRLWCPGREVSAQKVGPERRSDHVAR